MTANFVTTSCLCVTCDRGDGDDDDDDDDEWEDTDEEGDFDSEGGFSGEDAGGREFLFMDEETKSRFTEYSLTSSVMRRSEQLSLLDDRFEKVNIYSFYLFFLFHYSHSLFLYSPKCRFQPGDCGVWYKSGRAVFSNVTSGLVECLIK